MLVVMVLFDLRVGPSDELAPSQPLPGEFGGTVGEPGRRVDRDSIVVKCLNVMVIVGSDYFQLGVIVDVADSDV